MPDSFNIQPRRKNLEGSSKEERLQILYQVFSEAEAVFTAKGREATKPLLITIYSDLVDLNKSKSEVNPLQEWNENGDLTEAQFNELNLRRKKLSNAVGIMTASGVVRHNLNKI